jgi:methionyl-tRNA synthetase
VFDMSGALDAIWDVVRALNRHVEQRAPWQLARDEARADELDCVLYDLADGLRAVAVALSAYMPDTSERIFQALKQPIDLTWAKVGPRHTVAVDGIDAAPPLFPRIEAPQTAA